MVGCSRGLMRANGQKTDLVQISQILCIQNANNLGSLALIKYLVSNIHKLQYLPG